MRIRKTRPLPAVLLLALCSLAPLSLGFLCHPLLAPAPSGTPPPPVALFSPTIGAALSSTAPGATADITVSLSIPAGHTLPIAAPVTLPAGWTVAGDAQVADGSRVGRVTGFMTTDRPDTTVCNTETDLDFFLLEATTNSAVTVSGADTDNNGHPQVVEDNFDALGTATPNQLPDGVDRYPQFLTSPALPALPMPAVKARYFGYTEAAGVADLYVTVLVLELAGGVHQLIPVVQDPTSPPLAPMNTMCAPQSVTLTLFGVSADNPDTAAVNEGGASLYTNPAVAGPYTLSALLVSEFDRDNDGVSNGLDNCPATANANQLDSDLDYVGNACEADSVQNFDVDGDGLENGYDNCIFVANPNQADSDFDDIGDACDLNPLGADGSNHYLACTDPVGIGVGDPGGPSCVPTAPPPPAPDKDGDRLPDAVETNTGIFVSFTDTGTDPNDVDTDKDGCADGEELSSNQHAGGRRNPTWFWDFFDVPAGVTLTRDKAVAVGDIVGIVTRFGSAGSAAGDPLAPPPPPPAYHTGYDRTAPLTGQEAWDLQPPDGSVTVLDIVLIVNQFGHSCLAPP